MTKLISCLFLSVLLLVTAVPLRADMLQELRELEQRYSQSEDDLLRREIDLDGLLQARVEFDGVGGFFKKLLFQRKKYKSLEASLEEATSGVEATHREMQSVWKAIQNQIFEIGQAYEGSGDYDTAIAYYCQVKPRTEREIFRVATCYKLKGDYAEAIGWFRKLDTSRDEVKFEIGECFRLWGKDREALAAYLEVLAYFSDTEIEQRALALVEDYSYSALESDFPTLHRNIAAVYGRRAELRYRSDFAGAVAAYRRSMEYLGRDFGDSPARASQAGVQESASRLTAAERVLEEQTVAAHEYYQRKLDDALNEYEHRRRVFDRELRQAEQDFDTSLNQARFQLQRKRDEYNRFLNQGMQAEAEQARQQAAQYENRINYLIANRMQIIEDDVRFERQNMERAQDEYQHIRNSRRQIVDQYLEPYRRAVRDARDRLDMITNLHRAAFEQY